MESHQNIDWTAIRQVALECLDATWDMVWWAERSREDDYDVDGAALHLAAIDTADDALTRAISMFEPGLFDSLVKASVGEGPRPDFQVGDICLPTAHEMAFILLRHAIFWVENGLAAQGVNPIEQLHELSAEAMHEKLRNLTAIKSLSLLTPQQFKGIGRFLHLGTLKPIESLLTIGQYNVVRAWIDREWAAVSRTPPKADQGGDDTAFRPAKEIRERFDFQDQFELRRFLTTHPTIRTKLAKTKDGKDIPNRPLIHIGDVEAAKRSEPRITDPLDLPAEKVDRAVEEVQRRKAEVDAQRLRGN